MSLKETELIEDSDYTVNSEFASTNTLSRLIDQTVDRKHGHKFFKKKGKATITPPTSPTSTNSFSSLQNGFYSNNLASSPRLVSDSSDADVDGNFKFLEKYDTPEHLEVFAISDGNVHNDTLSNRSHGSKPGSRAGTLPGTRESNFSEDRYRWNDTETSASKKPKQTNTRLICLIVFITILVLALIAVAVAVILVYEVFDVGEKEENTTTIRPEILLLEGSLDLKETWTDELINPDSALYKSTANNFTLEIDTLMKNSSYSDSYIRTEVVRFSPGSIKVRFKMLHNELYKRKGRTAHQFAQIVRDHLVENAPESHLHIDTRTIYLQVFPLVIPTTLPSSTTDVPPHTSSAINAVPLSSLSTKLTSRSTKTTQKPSTLSMVSSPFTATVSLSTDASHTSDITPTSSPSTTSSSTQTTTSTTASSSTSSSSTTSTSSTSATTETSTTSSTSTISTTMPKPYTTPMTTTSIRPMTTTSITPTTISTTTPTTTRTTTLPTTTTSTSMSTTTTLPTTTRTTTKPTTTTSTTTPTTTRTTTTPTTTITTTTPTTTRTTTTPTTTRTTTTPTTTRTTTTPTTTITTTTPTTTRTATTPATTRTTTTPTTTRTTTTPTTTRTTTTPTTTITTTTPTTTRTATTPATTRTTTTPTTTITTTTPTTTRTTTMPKTTSSATTPTTTQTTSTPTTTEPDRPPVADAGVDISITLPRSSVILDGSASTDDHGIISYYWQKLAPQSVKVEMIGRDSKVLSVSGLVEGTYIFSLTVSDKSGQRDQDSVTVLVYPAPTTTTMSTSTTPKPDLCQPVNFTMCSTRGFIHTVFPNFFDHLNEREAEEAFMITAEPVINQICQEAALNYLCSVYFPKCDAETGYFIVPCNNLCYAANDACGNYFHNPFDCGNFPDRDCLPLSTTTTTTAATTSTSQRQTCEPTLLDACRALGFNETRFPNFFYEPTQEGAIVTYENYLQSAVTTGCHEDTLFFVCSIQFPKCVSGVNKKPCRRVCKAVTEACPDISYFFECGGYEEIDCISPPKPPAECKQGEFTCGRVTKCISEDKVCNGLDDCGDWTDEMNCVCGEFEYQCDMGMCIKSYQRCDGEYQCPDNSDEEKCDGCTHGAVKCPSGECIMSEWLCDGRAECKDGWDEYNCDVCGINQFTCADRHRTCIDLRKRCDGFSDCPDGYDEWDCINQEKGILEIPHMKFFIPVCADSWHDDLGNYTCTQLLGEGAYINKTDIAYNVHAFASLTAQGTQKSVLGPWEISYDCPGSKGLRVNCKPRGCGKRMVESLTEVIVNGENALPGEFPWHVALYFGGQYFCGGSLISDSFVITAAHCVEQFKRDFKLMTVKLGANNRQLSETTQHVIKVEAIESHTEHVYFKRNDIALLQLEAPVTFTKYIQPICLPKPEDDLPLYSTCFTVGWGKTKWDGDYAEVLQKLKMTLWDTKKCNSSIAWNGEVYDTFLCAGYYSGVRSICKGDSGGPLLCKDGTNTWKIFGVASYVANFCNMTERPNIYTNVTHLLPWIQEKSECKFRCDNGKCLYYTSQLCDRIDNCGDNSDEDRICNKTVSCDFEDKFLCGYEYKGWKLGYDNKNAEIIELDGQIYTKSNAPQFDSTIGKYPGKFFYGKEKSVLEAELLSPKFSANEQACIRFAYYQRGSIKLGLTVRLYTRNGIETGDYTTPWGSSWKNPRYLDEWKTGYFNVPKGEWRLMFVTGDLLSTAVDDIVMMPGMCEDVLCRSDEFRCRNINQYAHKCIPAQSRCNLAIDCEEKDDETTCTQETNTYKCTFENGNLCALYQEVGDASDWWLVNATFVRAELVNRVFVDHTSGTDQGYLFYINANNLQTSSNHIYMWQQFYLRPRQYCFSFYYQMKAHVNFNIHVNCKNCTGKTYVAQSTFDEKWTLFQINLPIAVIVNITYDVEGKERSEGFLRAYIALDDTAVTPGTCPQYVCEENYTKCKSFDRCIPNSALCDRKVDCLDESDEEQCDCTPNEFRCRSGRCIPQIYKCDRNPQCLDSSDEGSVCQSLLSVSCTFEHPYMCGYEFQQYTQFHWQRHQGSTQTFFTGPEVDHTYFNESGHYMYTEANKGSKMDNASLLSPPFNTNTGQSVQFYYHMLSYEPTHAMPGVFQFSLENLQTQTSTIEWKANVFDLKDEWRKVCVDLPNFSNLRLWFTVIRNENTTYGVDIAVDDVNLNMYTCAEATSPPPTTTIQTPSRTTTQGCRADQFECADTTCIKASYRCDNEPDCPDSSDELYCT